jgi:hypothetical protein
MKDFAKPYSRVQHFGLWASESADEYGKRDAMAILADAAGRCFDEDMPQRQELQDALEYLARATPAAPSTSTASGRHCTSRTRLSGSG